MKSRNESNELGNTAVKQQINSHEAVLPIFFFSSSCPGQLPDERSRFKGNAKFSLPNEYFHNQTLFPVVVVSQNSSAYGYKAGKNHI